MVDLVDSNCSNQSRKLQFGWRWVNALTVHIRISAKRLKCKQTQQPNKKTFITIQHGNPRKKKHCPMRAFQQDKLTTNFLSYQPRPSRQPLHCIALLFFTPARIYTYHKTTKTSLYMEMNEKIVRNISTTWIGNSSKNKPLRWKPKTQKHLSATRSKTNSHV